MFALWAVVQVVVVAWVIATVFFLITYTSPCLKLPPAEQLKYFELGGSDQDIFSGVDDTDARGLKHFPRLWCGAWSGLGCPNLVCKQGRFLPQHCISFTACVVRLSLYTGSLN